MLLSVNEKKEEIFWDELPEHGDIADRVTRGRTMSTFRGKINSFHGFNYNGIGSLLAAKVEYNTNAAISELSRLWPEIEFRSR